MLVFSGLNRGFCDLGTILFAATMRNMFVMSSLVFIKDNSFLACNLSFISNKAWAAEREINFTLIKSKLTDLLSVFLIDFSNIAIISRELIIGANKLAIFIE